MLAPLWMLLLKAPLHQSINTIRSILMKTQIMKPAILKSRQTNHDTESFPNKLSLCALQIKKFISILLNAMFELVIPIQCSMIYTYACDRKSRECSTCVFNAYCISVECQKGLSLIYSFDTFYYQVTIFMLNIQKYWSRFCVHWSFFFFLKLSHWPLHFHKYLWSHFKQIDKRQHFNSK